MFASKAKSFNRRGKLIGAPKGQAPTLPGNIRLGWVA